MTSRKLHNASHILNLSNRRCAVLSFVSFLFLFSRNSALFFVFLFISEKTNFSLSKMKFLDSFLLCTSVAIFFWFLFLFLILFLLASHSKCGYLLLRALEPFFVGFLFPLSQIRRFFSRLAPPHHSLSSEPFLSAFLFSLL